MKKLQVIVEYAGDNLSAYINDLPIVYNIAWYEQKNTSSN